MPTYNVVTFTELRAIDNEQIKKQIAAQGHRKTIINLIGRTGSGKSTQGLYLSAKTGLPHISIGDLFRDEVRNKTQLGKLIEIFEDNNPKEFPPDEIWFGILLKRLSKPDCAKGYIIDNFPRTPEQASVFLNGMIGPEDHHIPIFVDLSEKIIRERLKNRYICPNCGVQVRALDGNHTGTCANTSCNGQKLDHRPEDCDESKMQRRFDIFNENINGILNVLEYRGLIYDYKLDGTEQPKDIANTIDRIILRKLSRTSARKFFIMRHAESMATHNPDLFAERVPDAILLTKEGHAQAKIAAVMLKKYFDNNSGRKLKIILNRATRIIETADEIRAVLGECVSDVVYDKRADELKHGRFNSLSIQQISETYPDVFEKFYYSGNEEEKLLESYKTSLPNGESKEDLFWSTTELLFDIEESSAQGEDILFIGHGANCRALEAALTGKDGIWLAREFDSMKRSEIISIDVNGDAFFQSVFSQSPKRESLQISNKPENRIAVIGAGASGTAILANLVQNLPRGSEIIIFDQTDTFGPGYVYDTKQPPCFLLNRTLANMQNIWGSQGFMHWISNNKALIHKKYSQWSELFPDSVAALLNAISSTNEDMVVPRSLYGMYLEYCFANLMIAARNNGLNVVTVNRKVTKVIDNYITCGEGHSSEEINVDYIVLATGHWQSPKPVEYGYASGFYNNPMVLGFAPIDMPNIKDKTILIKGTSLSAIDAAIVVLELGAKKVTMFSRHGKLCSVSGLWKERNLEHLTLENLKKLAIRHDNNNAFFRLEHVFQLMVKELEVAGIQVDWSEAIKPKDPIKSSLDEIIQCQKGQEFLWRTIFESSFPIHQEIFSRLHPDDKKAFVTKWLSSFMSYNATTPLASLERLVKYFEDGRLAIMSGEARLSYNESLSIFEASFETNTECPIISADILIPATGQDREIAPMNLYCFTRDGDIFSKNQFGGVRISETYNVIDNDSKTKSNIFAIGPIISGKVLNFSNFETIYLIAAKISTAITQEIKNRDTAKNKYFLPGFNLYSILAGAAVIAGCAYYAKQKLRA